jgi:hypothetical protein
MSSGLCRAGVWFSFKSSSNGLPAGGGGDSTGSGHAGGLHSLITWPPERKSEQSFKAISRKRAKRGKAATKQIHQESRNAGIPANLLGFLPSSLKNLRSLRRCCEIAPQRTQRKFSG